eukprot:3507863-Amphidinium_carterae.1
MQYAIELHKLHHGWLKSQGSLIKRSLETLSTLRVDSFDWHKKVRHVELDWSVQSLSYTSLQAFDAGMSCKAIHTFLLVGPPVRVDGFPLRTL